ncbi:MAG TPA: BMP family ABC transporter substrate-binding protein, partial [Roseiflexaceae bacterium]|nr:BMP family ABC transporter substrate-binding protein [Roseiflexaceae bacterium]
MTRVWTRWTSVALLGLSLVLGACGASPAASPTTAPAEPTTAAAPTTAAEPTTAATSEATAATEPTAATAATEPAAGGEEFIVGMVLVGPTNDGGWNQAHYDAAKYVESKLPGTKFIYVDKVNPADKPNVTVQQVIDELISQGAKFVITNSAEFADGTDEAATAHPDVYFLHASGDKVLTGEAPANVTNLMGRMEYGKMIAGCAAALQTETGKISYLGPLVDAETRRLVNSTFLGARYCWETYRSKPASELGFKVTWIGFWFNIPGVTLDPTKVANDFINEGSDVILSGIDTTEALVEANKATQAGKKIYAVPYDFKDACAQGPQVCLGVPYFNWGPDYVRIIGAARQGEFKSAWEWVAPDWSDLNNPDTSMIGFEKGSALSADNQAKLDEFIKGMA